MQGFTSVTWSRFTERMAEGFLRRSATVITCATVVVLAFWGYQLYRIVHPAPDLAELKPEAEVPSRAHTVNTRESPTAEETIEESEESPVVEKLFSYSELEQDHPFQPWPGLESTVTEDEPETGARGETETARPKPDRNWEGKEGSASAQTEQPSSPEETATATAMPEIRYKGLVRGNGRLVALVHYEGQYLILAEGEALNSGRILDISRKQLKVHYNNQQHIFNLAGEEGT